MNNKYYKFPDSAEFGRVVSKSKIYQHVAVTSKVKALFVAQVDQMIWSYKLSSATINLPASDDVQEIQIFTIRLKTRVVSLDVLKTIDKAIPSPILFVLSYNGKYRYAAAYKRPSEADKNKWVVSSYFQSEWLKPQIDTDKHRLGNKEDNNIGVHPCSSVVKELPVVLNMRALYEALLKDLIPQQSHGNESFQGLIDRAERISKLEREAVKLENRIKKEKQFNRRVELNRMLNELKTEIEELKI